MWLRVFGALETLPEPDALTHTVMEISPAVQTRFEPGEHGWQRAEIQLPDGTTLYLDRFRREEEGVRGELQAWAAYLETRDDSPNNQLLMQHVISTAQVFALRWLEESPDVARHEPIAIAMCQHLAATTDGVYQVEGTGFFAPDGSLLLDETLSPE